MMKTVCLIALVLCMTVKSRPAVIDQSKYAIVSKMEIESLRGVNMYRAIYHGRRCQFHFFSWFASHQHSNECQFAKCKSHMSFHGGGPVVRMKKLGHYAGLMGEGVGGVGISDGCAGTKGLSLEGHRWGILNSRYTACGIGMNDLKSLVPMNDDDENDDMQYLGGFVPGDQSFSTPFHQVRTVDYDQRVKMTDVNEFREMFKDMDTVSDFKVQVNNAKYLELKSTGFKQITHSSLNCEGQRVEDPGIQGLTGFTVTQIYNGVNTPEFKELIIDPEDEIKV